MSDSKAKRYRKRGPASELDQLTVIEGGFAAYERPKPPKHLTDRQAEIWKEITLSEPADFFTTVAVQGMLSDLVCHRDSIEELNGIIRTFKPEWIRSGEGAKRYRELLKMRADETKAVACVCTKLRLTNQSRYTPKAAATAAKNTSRGVRPWEEE